MQTRGLSFPVRAAAVRSSDCVRALWRSEKEGLFTILWACSMFDSTFGVIRYSMILIYGDPKMYGMASPPLAEWHLPFVKLIQPHSLIREQVLSMSLQRGLLGNGALCTESKLSKSEVKYWGEKYFLTFSNTLPFPFLFVGSLLF